MDKDRIKGAAQKIKGSLVKAVGKLTGNKKLERDGAVDKAVGSAREGVGKAKDAVREKAVDLGHKTAEKANELKDQAANKIDDFTKGQPVKK